MDVRTITLKTPKPKYKNTVVCPNCWAEYTPKKCLRAYDLSDRNSTTPREFNRVMVVPANTCPNCLYENPSN